MKKLAFIAAAFAVSSALFASAPAFADSPGQLSNGASNYKVRNVTKNGQYSQSVAATCDETVKYSITLSNSDYGLLTNLMVNANLGSGAIAASATNANNEKTSVTGSATVSVNKGTLTYVPGSTVRITSDNTGSTNLPDGIVGAGVNAGNLNGSTAVFIQFQAKVNCPTVPPVKIQVCELATKNIITIDEKNFDSKKHSTDLNDCKEVVTPGKIQVCELTTKKIVTIKEADFDSKKHTKNLNDCKDVPATPVTPVTPSELPQTGAASGIAAAFGLSALAAGAAYVVQSRRNTLG